MIMSNLTSKVLQPSPISVTEFYEALVPIYTKCVPGGWARQGRIGISFPFLFIEFSDGL